jgi:hypothetical protein
MALSRRQFITAAAGATGMALGAGILAPGATLAHGGTVSPRPIPGGIDPFGNGHIFHVFLPGHGAEPSTVYDLNGVVGLANLRSMGTATDTDTGTTTRLISDVDTRVMQGIYIGVDGERHTGTFAFI